MTTTKHLSMKTRKERIKDQEVQHWVIQNETSNTSQTGKKMKRREMGTVDGVNGKEKNQMRRKELEKKG